MNQAASLLGAALLLVLPGVHAQGDMGQILGQLREVVLAENRGSSEVESAAALVAKQSGDGSWPDIDYAGKRDMQWEPSAHATRIQNLAVAYCTPGSPCFGHPPVAAAIHRALGYWR